MSMDANGRAHTPAGVSDGGQFATQPRSEADVTLGHVPNCTCTPTETCDACVDGGRHTPALAATGRLVERMIAAGEIPAGHRGLAPVMALGQWAETNDVAWHEIVDRDKGAGALVPVRAGGLVDGDRIDVGALRRGFIPGVHVTSRAENAGVLVVQLVQPSTGTETGNNYVQLSDDDGEFVGEAWLPEVTWTPVDPSEWRCTRCGRDTQDGEGYDSLCGGCADAEDD